MAQARLNVLGISGSLRKASFSTALLAEIASWSDAAVCVTPFPLHEVPLYNQDMEPVHGEAPAGVLALRGAIATADGLIVVSPEYNYGMPGILKNALDWASRPAYTSVLAGKPVLIVTNSPGITGGVRAQEQLRQTFFATQARVVPRPELIVTDAWTKLEGGGLNDDQTHDFLRAGLADLIAEIARGASATAT